MLQATTTLRVFYLKHALYFPTSTSNPHLQLHKIMALQINLLLLYRYNYVLYITKELQHEYCDQQMTITLSVTSSSSTQNIQRQLWSLVISCTIFLTITDPGMQASTYAIQHIWCLSQARINWEGCDRKGIWRKIWWMMEVGASMVRMGWHPAGLSVHMPLLSSPHLITSRMMTDSHTFQVWVGECLFWYRPTRVVPDKGL